MSRDNMSIPIIKLEVEGMRRTVQMALSEFMVQQDAMLKAALDAYLTEDNISRIVNETVRVTIQDCIKDAAQNYYKYGEGAKHIRALVVERLNEQDRIQREEDARMEGKPTGERWLSMPEKGQNYYHWLAKTSVRIEEVRTDALHGHVVFYVGCDENGEAGQSEPLDTFRSYIYHNGRSVPRWSLLRI